MLTVKTYIDKSELNGIGLYADEFIPKDSIIWKYDPEHDRCYSEEEYNNCEPLTKEFLKKYSFRYLGKYYLCIDNSRFFNHSEDPNCHSTDYSETFLGYTRAKRDIHPGEEITDDYRGFGFDEMDNNFNDFTNRK